MTCSCQHPTLRGLLARHEARPREERLRSLRFGDDASKAKGTAYGHQTGKVVGEAVGTYFGDTATGAAVGDFVGGVVGGVIGGLFGSTPYDCSFFSANWPDVPLTAEEDSFLPKPVRDAIDHQADVWAQTSYQTWDPSWQQTVDGCFPNLGSMYEGVRVQIHRATIAGIKQSQAAHAWTKDHPLPLPPSRSATASKPWTTGQKVAVGAGGVAVLAAGGVGVFRAVTGRWPWERR